MCGSAAGTSEKAGNIQRLFALQVAEIGCGKQVKGAAG